MQTKTARHLEMLEALLLVLRDPRGAISAAAAQAGEDCEGLLPDDEVVADCARIVPLLEQRQAFVEERAGLRVDDAPRPFVPRLYPSSIDEPLCVLWQVLRLRGEPVDSALAEGIEYLEAVEDYNDWRWTRRDVQQDQLWLQDEMKALVNLAWGMGARPNTAIAMHWEEPEWWAVHEGLTAIFGVFQSPTVAARELVRGLVTDGALWPRNAAGDLCPPRPSEDDAPAP
jgi:hypothetical protein